MTPNEFKAWFDGFTEAFTGCPTKAQWTWIKTRVAEIDGKTVTQTVYLDRYVRPYPYWNYPGIGICSSNALGISQVGGVSQLSNMTTTQNCSSTSQIGSGGPAFNSLQAMNELGRAEAKLS